MKALTVFDMEELEKVMDLNRIDNLLQVDNVAIHSGSAFSSEVILVNRTGESVFWQEVYAGTEGPVSSKIQECEIEFTPDGKAYFEPTGRHSSRRYLENFIRKNYGRSVE